MPDTTDLLELQALDVEVLRARKRLDELPEKTAILETRARIREIQSMHQKAELLLRKLQAEIKARQDEVASLTDKIEHEQKKLMETTDHRMVQSITREMDGLKRRTDKLEMEEIKYMERVEKADAQVATIDDALSKLAEKDESLVKQFQQAGGTLQKEIAELEARRVKLAAKLPGDLLGKYETTREAKGGVGVGTLEGETCTACRMRLPGEQLQRLASGPDIATCPQCRRMLVVRSGDDR